ncbi:hypothetical protein BGZ94_002149 [Podila epigama]|nr:hypothetical protein BGZ94_002149 [Podila epigama]
MSQSDTSLDYKRSTVKHRMQRQTSVLGNMQALTYKLRLYGQRFTEKHKGRDKLVFRHSSIPAGISLDVNSNWEQTLNSPIAVLQNTAERVVDVDHCKNSLWSENRCELQSHRVIPYHTQDQGKYNNRPLPNGTSSTTDGRAARNDTNDQAQAQAQDEGHWQDGA